MDLKTANIVIVGAFNPAIISPPWLAQQGIGESKFLTQTVDFEFLGQPGGACIFQHDDCEWTVSSDRLILKPSTAASPVGKIRRLLEKLPHTPVGSIGFNYLFECVASEWVGGVPTIGERAPNDLTFGGPSIQRVWISTSRRSESLLTVTLSLNDSLASVSINVHRDARDHDRLGRALDEYEVDMAYARMVVKQLEGQT
jgi:hypothetical protein